MKQMGITTASSFGGNTNDGVNNQKQGRFSNLRNNNNANNNNNNNNNNGGGNNNQRRQNDSNNGGSNDKNGGDDQQQQQDDEKKRAENEPSAVLGQPPNSIKVNVSSNNKYGLRNFLVRARRILRLSKTCKICGIGSGMFSV